MNFSCIFLLALALFGAVSEAYFASGAVGYGGVGALGYNGLCETSCGAPYGAGYGGGYGAGYGCRTSCGGAAVCDTCQCMKTVVRPSAIERIPYSCSRRVQSGGCRSSCGLYSGGLYGGAGVGALGGAGIGALGGAGYGNGGYLY